MEGKLGREETPARAMAMNFDPTCYRLDKIRWQSDLFVLHNSRTGKYGIIVDDGIVHGYSTT